MTRWERILAKPLAAGWSPQRGDRVWLPRRRPYLRSATGRVDGPLLAGFFRVAYRVNGYDKQAHFAREDLRPWVRPRRRRRSA